jgi:hypothetical protein
MLGAMNPAVSHYINGDSCYEIDTVTMYRSMNVDFAPMLGTFEGSCAKQGYTAPTGSFTMSPELVWTTYQKKVDPQQLVLMLI